jgi:tellurite resistance protein TerC
LIFAVDSIPAVLAITRDPFVVYTSNIFAILGLRALYFALTGVMNLFHHLHYGLSVILVFIGAKMIIAHWWEIPTAVALGVVAAVLGVAVGASLIWPEKKTQTTNMQSP